MVFLKEEQRHFMHYALQAAQEGVEKNYGGPFGACIVRDGAVVSVAYNTVVRDDDPTCHAEINAIRKACRQLKRYHLKDCQLYTSMEPCPMCLAAIYWAHIPEVYVGGKKDLAAAYGFCDVKFYEELALPNTEREVSLSHVDMDADCEKIFKKWKELQRALY